VSVVTVMLDPPGPPRAKVLRRLHGLDSPAPKCAPIPQPNLPEAEPATSKGIAIMLRFPNSKNTQEQLGTNLVAASPTPKSPEAADAVLATRIIFDSSKSAPVRMLVSPNVPPSFPQQQPPQRRKTESVSKFGDGKLQCNDVTSSTDDCDDDTPPPVPTRPAGGHRPQNNKPASGSKPSAPSPMGSPSRPNTRTRQPSGAAKPSQPLPTQEPKSASPPPLPVKQIRRSILPGATGYDSDSENQPQLPASKPPVGTATPRTGARNLRSASSAKKPSVPVAPLPAVTKTRRSEAATLNATPETNIRVLRSRNTPASVTQPRCENRSRTASASASAASATPQKLPETGVKRKRSSAEPGVPTLAAKMLKLSQHAKAPSWVNPLGKRSMNRPAK